ncbi:MAG: transglutaminase family protein [Pirellulales bacterium]
MLFHLKHVTRFSYSKPVFCEPLTLRLRPREDAGQRLLRFQMQVEPVEAGSGTMIDLDGNSTTQLWFSEMTLSLAITTTALVETLRTNPYDFLLQPEALRLPLTYPDVMRQQLAPYLMTGPIDPSVAGYARRAADMARGDTVTTLSRLAAGMYESFRRHIREEGHAWPAAETLASRTGSCRDLAVLFNECCRSLGLAARFVSGYYQGEDTGAEKHLHAWSEVYLPGAGWVAFDPSRGLAVADRHVALAAAPHPAGAAPTEGTFRGPTDVHSSLTATISLRVEPSAGPPEPHLRHAMAMAAELDAPA